jgi:hypothetical protein
LRERRLSVRAPSDRMIDCSVICFKIIVEPRMNPD